VLAAIVVGGAIGTQQPLQSANFARVADELGIRAVNGGDKLAELEERGKLELERGASSGAAPPNDQR
jgi:hypothetical protein